MTALKIALKEEFSDLRFSPALDYDMAIQAIDCDIRALFCSRLRGLKAQSAGQVSPQSLQISFRFLDLGLLLGSAGFCNEVHGQLIRGSAADEVW